MGTLFLPDGPAGTLGQLTDRVQSEEYTDALAACDSMALVTDERVGRVESTRVDEERGLVAVIRCSGCDAVYKCRVADFVYGDDTYVGECPECGGEHA